jgi:hypothetical protein
MNLAGRIGGFGAPKHMGLSKRPGLLNMDGSSDAGQFAVAMTMIAEPYRTESRIRRTFLSRVSRVKGFSRNDAPLASPP